MTERQKLLDGTGPVYVNGHLGIGDQIYARPFLVEVAKRRDVYVRTAWPEMWWDQPRIHPCHPRTSLRTQAIHAAGWSGTWAEPPIGCERTFITFEPVLMDRRSNVMDALAEETGVRSWAFGLPLQSGWLEDAAADYIDESIQTCIVRPPTIRAEWPCPSRNPDPAAFAAACATMRALGFRLVAVAHLEDGAEWLDGVGPDLWDEGWLSGEIPWYAVAAMMHLSGWVLTAQGFGSVMGPAVGARTMTVYGGFLPARALEHPCMVPWAARLEPEDPCWCMDARHDCDKRIELVRERVEEWVGAALSA